VRRIVRGADNGREARDGEVQEPDARDVLIRTVKIAQMTLKSCIICTNITIDNGSSIEAHKQSIQRGKSFRLSSPSANFTARDNFASFSINLFTHTHIY
jgi:hypothetical protein